MDERTMVLRLVVAFVIGALLGGEREQRHKPAGVRTHALVCLGATLFTLISIYGFVDFAGQGSYRNMDPARIAAQIVVGVGFIGGGLIFREKTGVQGLTTAASIWLTAGLGTAIGVGMYTLVAVSLFLGLLALRLNRILRFLGHSEQDELN